MVSLQFLKMSAQVTRLNSLRKTLSLLGSYPNQYHGILYNQNEYRQVYNFAIFLLLYFAGAQ